MMKTAIRTIGNDKVVLIPQAVLEHLALESDEVEIELQKGALVIRAPTISVPAPLEADTPVWDDYNDPGEWQSLSEQDMR
jgi:hypothetical protein